MLGFVATDRSHQVLLTCFDEEARLFAVSEAMGDPFACLQIAHSGHRLQAIKKLSRPLQCRRPTWRLAEAQVREIGGAIKALVRASPPSPQSASEGGKSAQHRKTRKMATCSRSFARARGGQSSLRRDPDQPIPHAAPKLARR
jgi:hypothetical protein